MKIVKARCIRRCWDSQLTMRYWQGQIVELPSDHVFLTMRNPCFEIVTDNDITKQSQEDQKKLSELEEKLKIQHETIQYLMNQDKSIRSSLKDTKIVHTKKRGRHPKTEESEESGPENAESKE